MDQVCNTASPPRNRDIVDFLVQALSSIDLKPRIRRKCVKLLYKTCAGHTLLPRSLRFELPEITTRDVQYRGGSADVLKYESGGREVAVKVLRVQGFSLEDMTNVSDCSELPSSYASVNQPPASAEVL